MMLAVCLVADGESVCFVLGTEGILFDTCTPMTKMFTEPQKPDVKMLPFCRHLISNYTQQALGITSSYLHCALKNQI